MTVNGVSPDSNYRHCCFNWSASVCPGAHEPASSICALKGSRVSLSCSAQHPSPRWYRLYANGSVEKELATGGSDETRDFNLTFKHVSEGDAGVYCCSPVERRALDECTGVATMLKVAGKAMAGLKKDTKSECS